MNLSIMSIMTALNPIILVAAFVPFFASSMMWAIFYLRYDIGRLMPLSNVLSKLAMALEKIEDCKKENSAYIDEKIVRLGPASFLDAWLHFKVQIENAYKGEFIPEGRAFFSYRALITLPGSRGSLDSIWKSFLVLGIVTAALPYSVASFIQPEASTLALALGGGLFLILCLGQLLFTLLDQSVFNKVNDDYDKFIYGFDRILPVTKPEVALLLEATDRNQKIYQEATDKIVNKFDTIVEDALLPALEDSISMIMHSNLIPAIKNIEKALETNIARIMSLQQEGISQMAEAFADRLGETVVVKMNGLGATIETVQKQFEILNRNLTEHNFEIIETMRTTLEQQELSMSKALELQELSMLEAQEEHKKAMTNTATAFTLSLTETLDANMAGLSKTAGLLQDQLVVLNDGMTTTIEGLNAMLTEQKEVLDQSAKTLLSASEIQNTTLEETRELQTKTIENNQILNTHVGMMVATLDKLTEQNTVFGQEAFQFTKDTNQAQQKMSEDIKTAQVRIDATMTETLQQYTRMSQMVSEMMDNITDKMNEAMTGAGREIAQGIKEVTADNAEAITNLTEQAANLRNDYETYFGRLEENTKNILDDMDYKVQNIVARITEDVGAMMKEAVEANGQVLDRYKDNTISLLQSFEEQASSISLYAKEINLDVTDLSTNLRLSVEEFSKKMQEGVNMTIGEFDSGLAELTQRIANTVESISDAVEALPSAIKGRS